MTSRGSTKKAAPNRYDPDLATAHGQLQVDLRQLRSGDGLAPFAVPPKPAPISPHRGFFTTVPMLVTFGAITFLGEACRAWWWPKDSLGGGFIGLLATLVIDLTLIIGSPIVGLVAAAIVGGVRAARTEREAKSYRSADFHHRFLDEREWLRQKLDLGSLAAEAAIGILGGEEAPLDTAQSLAKGSALTRAARYAPVPAPRPPSSIRRAFTFLGHGLLILFLGALFIAELADPDTSAADIGADGDTTPREPATPRTDEALHRARDVVAADIAALEAGRQLVELPAPAGPEHRKPGRTRRFGCGGQALVVLALTALCYLVTRGWVTDGGLLDTAFALLFAGLGGLIGLFLVMVVASFFVDSRAGQRHDDNASDRLRHDFWREREGLRSALAGGAQTPTQVIAMLRGLTPAPPTISEVIASGRGD